MSSADVVRLTRFVLDLSGFEIQPDRGPCYAHMGATITDAILQSGLNYRTIVAPRIRRLLLCWPDASRTSIFLEMLTQNGLNQILQWRHSEKPVRIGQLTELLLKESVEIESDLSGWLNCQSNCERLRTVRGIGPKTVDYLKSLVGLQSVAVDRHVRTFVALAGVEAKSYEEIHEVVRLAAEELGIGLRSFDRSIWNFVSAEDRKSLPVDAQKRFVWD